MEEHRETTRKITEKANMCIKKPKQKEGEGEATGCPSQSSLQLTPTTGTIWPNHVEDTLRNVLLSPTNTQGRERLYNRCLFLSP